MSMCMLRSFYIHLNPKIYTLVHSVMALQGLDSQTGCA